jgi:glycosyltransferase involved in cell wall biosynthesis
MKNPDSQQPAVSIALCTYNGERFLVEQLESILNQDYPNIEEIICVDDNSKDTTWDILTQYAEKYSVFKIFRNSQNLGFVKNYEKAITLTTNQLIAISDQDDIWYSNKISKLVHKIGSKLMVYSDNEFIDLNGKSLGMQFSDKRNLTTCTSCLNFALFNAISGHTILFNRELLNYALPFHNEIPYDFWLAFKAVQYEDIQVVNEPLVGYRQHDNNTIGAFKKKIKRKDLAFEELNESQIRIQIFAKNTAPHLSKEQKILEQLAESYANRSLLMRLKRIIIFWKNKDNLLLFTKRSSARKMFYCFKVFWKYD